MSDLSFSLNSILNDLSNNINNLYTDYNTQDISSALNDISLNIFETNQKLEEILNLYNTVEELKQRLNS